MRLAKDLLAAARSKASRLEQEKNEILQQVCVFYLFFLRTGFFFFFFSCGLSCRIFSCVIFPCGILSCGIFSCGSFLGAFLVEKFHEIVSWGLSCGKGFWRGPSLKIMLLSLYLAIYPSLAGIIRLWGKETLFWRLISSSELTPWRCPISSMASSMKIALSCF